MPVPRVRPPVVLTGCPRESFSRGFAPGFSLSPVVLIDVCFWFSDLRSVCITRRRRRPLRLYFDFGIDSTGVFFDSASSRGTRWLERPPSVPPFASHCANRRPLDRIRTSSSTPRPSTSAASCFFLQDGTFWCNSWPPCRVTAGHRASNAELDATTTVARACVRARSGSGLAVPVGLRRNDENQQGGSANGRGARPFASFRPF